MATGMELELEFKNWNLPQPWWGAFDLDSGQFGHFRFQNATLSAVRKKVAICRHINTVLLRYFYGWFCNAILTPASMYQEWCLNWFTHCPPSLIYTCSANWLSEFAIFRHDGRKDSTGRIEYYWSSYYWCLFRKPTFSSRIRRKYLVKSVVNITSLPSLCFPVRWYRWCTCSAWRV